MFRQESWSYLNYASQARSSSLYQWSPFE